MIINTRIYSQWSIVPFVFLVSSASADNRVAALLQFAEQYRSESINKSDSEAEMAAEESARANPTGDKFRHGDYTKNKKKSHNNKSGLEDTLKAKEKEINSLKVLLDRERGALINDKKTSSHCMDQICPSYPRIGGSEFTWALQKITDFKSAIFGEPDQVITKALLKKNILDLKKSEEEVDKLRNQIIDLKNSRLEVESFENSVLKKQLKEKIEQNALLQENIKAENEKHRIRDVESDIVKLGSSVEKDHALKKERQDKSSMQAIFNKAVDMKKMIKSMEEEKVKRNKSHQDLERSLALKDVSLKALQLHLDVEIIQKRTLSNRLKELNLARNKQDILSEDIYENHSLEIEKQAYYENDLAAHDNDPGELTRNVGKLPMLPDKEKSLNRSNALDTNLERQAYATGAAFGYDALEMLDEHESWGVNTNRKSVLSGMIDVFTGQSLLTKKEMQEALVSSESLIIAARDQYRNKLKASDELFLNTFKKRDGVVKSSYGFWYVINYAGDVDIAPNSIVDVVVKEMLTDGTVIQDMDLAGNVLSQPLESFPDLFREALSHLRNHGSLTMVVPPHIAYGEDGFPPKVPPNATMVYEVRIADSSI